MFFSIEDEKFIKINQQLFNFSNIFLVTKFQKPSKLFKLQISDIHWAKNIVKNKWKF